MKGRELFITLFALGVVALTWPLLTVVNRPRLVAGIPVLVLYLFAVWGAVILVLAWLARRES